MHRQNLALQSPSKSFSQVPRMAGWNVLRHCVFQLCSGTIYHFILGNTRLTNSVLFSCMTVCREQASCREERKSLLISGIGRRDGKNYEGERQERKLAGAFIVRRGRRKWCPLHAGCPQRRFWLGVNRIQCGTTNRFIIIIIIIYCKAKPTVKRRTGLSSDFHFTHFILRRT